MQWPTVLTEEGETLNAGVFNSDSGEGGYRAWLMDANRDYTWFTMYHQDLNLLIGYIFSKEENPWIGDWQENQRSQALPRNGETIAWGLDGKVHYALEAGVHTHIPTHTHTHTFTHTHTHTHTHTSSSIQ